MTPIVFGSPEAQEIIEADKELDRPRLKELQGTLACRCGKEVKLWAETDAWTKNDETGAWEHSEFGPAMGMCECGRLYVDSWDGLYLYGPKKEIDR